MDTLLKLHAEAMQLALLILAEPIVEGLEAAQQQYKGTSEISAISICVFIWISITPISVNPLSICLSDLQSLLNRLILEAVSGYR